MSQEATLTRKERKAQERREFFVTIAKSLAVANANLSDDDFVKLVHKVGRTQKVNAGKEPYTGIHAGTGDRDAVIACRANSGTTAAPAATKTTGTVAGTSGKLTCAPDTGDSRKGWQARWARRGRPGAPASTPAQAVTLDSLAEQVAFLAEAVTQLAAKVA